MVEGSSAEAVSSLAYVNASAHRASVVFLLADWPKTTSQVAMASGLSLPHASRAIHDLVGRGFVKCLTPELHGRGRLYGLTDDGQVLSDGLLRETRRPVTLPMIRASTPRAWYLALAEEVGSKRAREAFRVATLTDVIDGPARRWIPLMVQLRLLETIERLFGNGSYDFVRRIARRSVPHYGSVRRYLLRALPLHVVIDLAPAAYLRELNHGRMEVDMLRNVAHFKHYDWLSSPARCNAWLGTYQGAFDVRRKAAEIRKTECLLRGDEFCGYVATWEG